MFWRDVLYALRSLVRSPATAVAAIVTVGLGIGGNTAAFSWTSALLLRPYDFEDLEALVTVWESHPQQSGNLTNHGRSAGDRNPMAPADFLDLRRQSRSFRRLSAYRYRELYLGGRGEPERLQAVQATPDLLQTLGVTPVLGRAFLAEEGQPGRDQAVLLSHGFWQRRFGGDPGVVGREITLDERACTIVGVLPAGLQFPLGGVDVWTPLAFTPDMGAERAKLSLRVLGRLGSVKLAAAQAEMDALAARLQQAHPLTNAGRSLTLVPLREQQIGILPPFLFLFHGAAGFVLLIACANVASLLLVRVMARQREMAVRSALGASRGRLVRLVLIENALLCLLGAGLAVLLAWSGVSFIRASLPQDIAQWVAGWKEIRVDGGALGFTLLVAVLTAVVSGLAPALQASGIDLTRALKDGGRYGIFGVGRSGVRRLVVVSQLILALVLTAGAALVATGFTRLIDVYQGFDPKGVLTLGIRLPEWRYTEPHQIASFYRRLVADLKTIPGVESAAVVSHLPADLGPVPGGGFSIEGRPASRPQELPFADLQTVSPAYFDGLRIPLLAGRPLTEQDDSGAAGVVLVSESLARRCWPRADPLGQRVKLASPEGSNPWLTVVGVVADVKQYWFDREPRPTLYLPYLQAPRRSLFVVLRTAGNPEELTAPARRRVRNIDAAQPIEEVRTFERVVAESLAFLRTAAGLITALAILACFLAAMGIYGLLGYHVVQGTHDFGVRMALGANRLQVLRLVLGQAAKMAFIAVAVGLPAAFALERILSGVLYGVVGSQPTILAALAAVLAAITLGAGYFPARRAADQDPADALRDV